MIEKEREQGENVMPIILYREVLFGGLLFKSNNTWMAMFFYKSGISS